MRGHRTPRTARIAERRAWVVRGAAVLAACLMVFCLVVFVSRGLRLRSLRVELEAIHQEQAAALDRQEDLRAELALRDDLGAIEERARRLLGWVLPGEEKVLFIGGE